MKTPKKNMPLPLLRGWEFEKIAAKLLKKNGYTIIARNYATVMGEIDIIAFKDKTISFIEVKARRNTTPFNPEEAVDSRKMRKISYVAISFLSNLARDGIKIQRFSYNFDVIGILFDDAVINCTLYKNFCVVDKDELCRFALRHSNKVI